MRLTTILPIVVLAAVAVQAQSPAKKTLRHLTAAQIDPARLLPPPAADGSDSQKQEMAEVRRLIHTRSAERLVQARWDAEHEDLTIFSGVMGTEFDLKKLPATLHLLEEVFNDQAVAVNTAKDFFKRKFPVSQAAPATGYSAWSCDTKDRKPSDRPFRSYPSGHATLGYSLGAVLAALVPEKSQAILTRAAEYSYSREICGDHYHSDTEASHVLGTTVAALLLSDPSLQASLQAAKRELHAAGITKN